MRGQGLHPTHPSLVRLLVALAAVAAFVLAPRAAGAPLLDNEHFGPETNTFSDQLCGIDGTSTTFFVGTFKLFADGTFLSTSTFRETFTSASTGKSLVNSGVEQVTGPFDPTDNGDGTITQTFVFKGLPVKVSLVNGPPLLWDAGNATVAITFMLNPDGTRGRFLSQTVVLEDGPHPGLDDGSAFCDAVADAVG
jgi:hypothetical protein